MDQLQKRRKMQIIALIVFQLQMLGDLMMILTLCLTYIMLHDNRRHKKRKWAVGLFKKPFPHYDDLALVYGKDKANGSSVECFADQAEAMDRKLEEETQNLNVDADEANLDGTPLDSVAETQDHPSPCNFSPHTTTVADVQNSTSTARGKRKRNGGTYVSATDRIVDTIEGLRKVYENKFGELILYFKNESDAANRKMQVFAELAKIEGLTATDRLRAGVIIMEKQSLVDCLFAIEPDMKYDFVQHILASHNS